MNTCAIGVMARAPSASGKTRLAGHLPPARLTALRHALLADTLGVVCGVRHVDPIVFVTPAGTEAEVLALAPRPIPVVPQAEGDLGDRLRHALRSLLDERGYGAAILVGTDAPLISHEHVAEALTLLRTRGGVVMGPADDGGYYLIGMTKVHEPLFDGMAWGADTVLLDTMIASGRLGLEASVIRGTYDVDTIDDLRRLERDLAGESPALAPNLRRFFSERS